MDKTIENVLENYNSVDRTEEVLNVLKGLNLIHDNRIRRDLNAKQLIDIIQSNRGIIDGSSDGRLSCILVQTEILERSPKEFKLTALKFLAEYKFLYGHSIRKSPEWNDKDKEMKAKVRNAFLSSVSNSEKCINQGHSSYQLHSYLGRAYSGLAELEVDLNLKFNYLTKALDNMERGITLGNENPDAYSYFSRAFFDRAEVRIELGHDNKSIRSDFSDSIIYRKKSIKLSKMKEPKLVDLKYLAIAHHGRFMVDRLKWGKYDLLQNIKYMLEILNRDSGFENYLILTRAYMTLAKIDKQLEKYGLDNAIKYISECIPLADNPVQLYFDLAHCYYNRAMLRENKDELNIREKIADMDISIKHWYMALDIETIINQASKPSYLTLRNISWAYKDRGLLNKDTKPEESKSDMLKAIEFMTDSIKLGNLAPQAFRDLYEYYRTLARIEKSDLELNQWYAFRAKYYESLYLSIINEEGSLYKEYSTRLPVRLAKPPINS